MRMRRLFWPVCGLAAAALVPFLTQPAIAADPLNNCQSGQPFLWPNGGAGIPFNPDQGDLGPLSNAAAVSLTQQSFNNWGNVATATASYTNAGALTVDVDITNFNSFLNPVVPDGLSAIVFDDTGEIFDVLFGPNSGVLGFAGPEFVNVVTCEILEARAFLNGPEFTDLLVAEDIMTHEFGHYSNLAHVELNGQLVNFGEGGDDSGPSPQNTFGTPLFDGTEVIETMYPFFFGNIDQGARTPHSDDVASISTLYPAPGFFTTSGTISGTVFALDGVTRLTGVNVIARNVADPFFDAVSAISGGLSDSISDQSDPVVGTYTLNGLTPGAEYVLFVDEITAMAGRFSTQATQPLPGPEEFWNGASETNVDPPDVPLDSVLITPGSLPTGIDIVFNAPSPGPIPLGDDDFVELPLPFEVCLCGESFASVFVNSNGSLTFGEGDRDFSETSAEFLNGPPRVAGAWDDLAPNNGGTVSFDQTATSFTASFDAVPEFLATGANSFSITLNASTRSCNDEDSDGDSGSQDDSDSDGESNGGADVTISYGALTMSDGLAGVSCGGAATSGFEKEIDLSSFGAKKIKLNRESAAFELFANGDNDLANTENRYDQIGKRFRDRFEDNDSIDEAVEIELPFDTKNTRKRFSEIRPAGGDVDFFEIEDLEAGETLVAEVLTGQIDSVLGVFQMVGDSGVLLAVDDDGGNGFLSKVIFEIPADGDYAVAVSTFPDGDFSGDGTTDPVQGQGRYVLDVFTIRGTLLQLGDDDSESVALDFSFPFAGDTFTSVFVNSNGNLTFGQGNTDFSESVGEFESGPPRIAPLWDDLSPNQGGLVVVNRESTSLSVTFIDVPQFLAGDANNFSITLFDTGVAEVLYGAVGASDGVVGATGGGGATSTPTTFLTTTTVTISDSPVELFNFLNPFNLPEAHLLTFNP